MSVDDIANENKGKDKGDDDVGQRQDDGFVSPAMGGDLLGDDFLGGLFALRGDKEVDGDAVIVREFLEDVDGWAGITELPFRDGFVAVMEDIGQLLLGHASGFS